MSIFGDLAEALFLAKRGIFGQKSMFLLSFFMKNFMEFLAEMDIFARKSCSRLKKVFWPKFWFGQNFSFLGGAYFSFGISAKILFCLTTM